MTLESAAPSLIFRVGGQPFFDRLVAAFYEGIATDDLLAPLYPDFPDFEPAKHRLSLFLAQYWGGPSTYMEERGHPRLRMRHFPFHVGPLERDRWLLHMAAAVERSCGELTGRRSDRRRADGLLRPSSRTPPQRHRSADLVGGLRQGLTMAVIEVRDLRKRYGETDAVAGISFDIAEGEVYGLLGHNGAGKSTTVEILEGHRRRSSGTVSVLGTDPADSGRDFRDRIGIVLQTSGVEQQLTVREALRFYGSCYRDPRPIDEVVEMVGLTAKVDDRIGSLSGGQRRRIDLALGIIGTPELLFLDEPTTGFDPVARRESWKLIQRLCEEVPRCC